MHNSAAWLFGCSARMPPYILLDCTRLRCMEVVWAQVLCAFVPRFSSAARLPAQSDRLAASIESIAVREHIAK